MKKEKKFLIYAVVVGLIVLTIAVIRSCIASITYDEAYTYLEYVTSNPFEVFKAIFTSEKVLANNHLLNSFSVSVIQFIFRIKYSAFLIRLPNLISYVVYLVFAYKFAKKYRYKFFVFTTLAFCCGLNEFISLARGYGMACAIVMIGIYYLKEWLEDISKYKYLNLSYLFLMISCYANTTCLIIFASIIVFTQLYILINKGIKENMHYIFKNILTIIPIAALTLLIIYFHFKVSSDGLPLYGGHTGFLTDVLGSYPYLYGIEFYSSIIAMVIVLILFVFVIRKDILKFNVAWTSLFFFAILIIMTLAFDQLWLTRRLLIPSVPLVMLSIFEIIDKIDDKYKIMLGLITLIPVVSFALSVNVTAVRTWEDNNFVKENAYKAYEEKNNELIKPYLKNYAINFYREKIKLEHDYDIFEGVK